jgi:hypothetical protein
VANLSLFFELLQHAHSKARLGECHNPPLCAREGSLPRQRLLGSAIFARSELGELTEPARRLVATLEMIPLARFVPSSRGWVGRPSKDRLAIASAFVAKAVYGFGLTRQLLDALASDAQLRRICGWEKVSQVPHESTFSRTFDEFARMELPQFVHETLIRETQKDRLIGNIARDSTAIEARERFPETTSAGVKPKASPKASAVAAAPAEDPLSTVPAEASAPTVLPATSVPAVAPAKRGRPKGKRGPSGHENGPSPAAKTRPCPHGRVGVAQQDSAGHRVQSQKSPHWLQQIMGVVVMLDNRPMVSNPY